MAAILPVRISFFLNVLMAAVFLMVTDSATTVGPQGVTLKARILTTDHSFLLIMMTIRTTITSVRRHKHNSPQDLWVLAIVSLYRSPTETETRLLKRHSNSHLASQTITATGILSDHTAIGFRSVLTVPEPINITLTLEMRMLLWMTKNNMRLMSHALTLAAP